ncbi:MAG: heavy metal-binding domain-containing protein, partial [Luteolibacter sp.]
MKTFITILLTAAIAVTGTWFYKSHMHIDASLATMSKELEPDHYQCAMHPWIKSDKPGRCTICGMELTPIFAGEKGFDSTGGDSIIPLTQNQIQVMNVQTVAAKTQPFIKTLKVAGTIDDDQHRHRII